MQRDSQVGFDFRGGLGRRRLQPHVRRQFEGRVQEGVSRAPGVATPRQGGGRVRLKGILAGVKQAFVKRLQARENLVLARAGILFDDAPDPPHRARRPVGVAEPGPELERIARRGELFGEPEFPLRLGQLMCVGTPVVADAPVARPGVRSGGVGLPARPTGPQGRSRVHARIGRSHGYSASGRRSRPTVTTTSMMRQTVGGPPLGHAGAGSADQARLAGRRGLGRGGRRAG